MYLCHGMPPLARHYHDLAKLNHLAVALYPCRGLPALARHYHDFAKLNDLCRGPISMPQHARLPEQGTLSPGNPTRTA